MSAEIEAAKKAVEDALGKAGVGQKGFERQLIAEAIDALIRARIAEKSG